MSWDGYIDNLLGQCVDNADKASIIGLDGSKWTTDAHAKHFKLTPAEAVHIAKVVKSEDLSSFQSNGIMMEGVKYQFLRIDGNVLYAKKKDHGAVTIQRTKTALVIGHTAEGKQQGAVNKGVGVVADYLESISM